MPYFGANYEFSDWPRKSTQKISFRNNKSVHWSDWYIDKMITQGYKDQHYLVSQERYIKKKLQCDVLNGTIESHQVLWEYNK